MRSYSISKIILLFLAVCIVFSVGFTGAITAANLGHDCCPTEKECVPCLKIEAAMSFLKIFKMISIFLFLAICLVFMLKAPEKFSGVIYYPLSPILLKIRINT